MRQVRRVAALFVYLLVASVCLHAHDQVVYVTKTGSKYHTSSCRSLRASKIAMSLSDAAARYQPCKICHPPVPGSDAATTPTHANAAAPASAPAQRVAEAGRCQAITKKGTQCSRRAKAGSKYCWQHGGYDPREAPRV